MWGNQLELGTLWTHIEDTYSLQELRHDQHRKATGFRSQDGHGTRRMTLVYEREFVEGTP